MSRLANPRFFAFVLATIPQEPGPALESRHAGDVAVVVDNGRMVTARNLFDLAGATVRFVPESNHRYAVSRFSGALEPSFGPALLFGFPASVLFPGDDDSEEIAFPAGFPFYGTLYDSVWVNTDGSITLGEPDFESSERDKTCHVLGPPRVSAFLHDWTPFNPFNPTGSGSVHAVVKTGPDRLVVTWNGVADTQGGVSSTFQVALHASGTIDITIVDVDAPSVYGVVGIAEGGGSGPIANVDLGAAGPARSVRGGAILEAFAAMTSVSEQETAREFYRTHEDKYDFLVILTDFPTDEPLHHSRNVSNRTHGIGNDFNPTDGGTGLETVFDFASEYGSEGELEQIVYLNDVSAFRRDPGSLMETMSRQVARRWGATLGYARATGFGHLDPAKVFFELPPGDEELADHGAPGTFNPLEQYLMGLRRAEDVGAFSWIDRGGRADLTVRSIQAIEGQRFWGPERDSTLRFVHGSRRADPFGNQSIQLSTADRELGDEADRVDMDGRPVDVKTMAFVLLVQGGPLADRAGAVEEVDAFRRAWERFANGPATGGRGRFDTRLDPPVD